MEIAGLFVTAFIVGLSGAMMPGPLLTVTIGESARHGMVAAPLIVLGHIILELLLVIALVMGLAGALSSGIPQWLAIFGGVIMFWMGWGMIKDVLSRRVSLPSNQSAVEGDTENNTAFGHDKSGRFRMRLVVLGILVSVANPYWILWWATVGLGYITMATKTGFTGMASFFTGHVLSDFVWYVMIGLAVSGGRRFFNDTAYRGILLVCGFLLFGIGGYFIYYGVF
ncbi:MAG: LysE family transporter [Syntrophomonadales bacterium]|jgi:threonine/homoserine/homoserine lactone efflux protein